MTDTTVIYENPRNPLPEWARWLSKDGATWVWQEWPVLTPSGWGRIGPKWDKAPNYTITGPWQESLRRLVRLSGPAYYVPENQFTDAEGFLPHDGGKMPGWVRGRLVQIKWRDGMKSEERPAEAWIWEGATHSYRIVGEKEEPSLADQLRRKGDDEAPIANPKAVDPAELKQEAERITQRHQDELPPGGVIPPASHGLFDKPRAPSNATGHQYQDVYTEDERRHRNELAARTLTPVPGMDSFMRGVIREARRFDYAKSILPGLISNDDLMREYAYGDDCVANLCKEYADAMIEKEASE